MLLVENLCAWALPGGAQDGAQVIVASPPLALRSLSNVETVDGVGWQNTPFDRVAPSAKRGNPHPRRSSRLEIQIAELTVVSS